MNASKKLLWVVLVCLTSIPHNLAFIGPITNANKRGDREAISHLPAQLHLIKLVLACRAPPSMNNLTLNDLKKEETFRSKCLKYNVSYIPPDGPQTDRNLMRRTLAKEKKAESRANRSAEAKEAENAAKRLKRAAHTEEERKSESLRIKLWRDAQTEEAKEAELAARALKRAAQTKEQRKSASLAKKRQRVLLSDEAKEASRIANSNQKRSARAAGRMRSSSRTHRPRNSPTPSTQNNGPDADVPSKIPEVSIYGPVKNLLNA